MHHSLALAAAAVAIAALTAALYAQDSKPAAPAPGHLHEPIDEPAFACDLYAHVASQHSGNLFFSPASIQVALAMTAAGARGNTADQFQKALHLAGTPDQINAAFGQILKSLHPNPASIAQSPATPRPDKPTYQLIMADALWGQAGFPFQPAYAHIVKNNFAADLNSVNFAAPETARKAINDWVAAQTHDKIKDLISAGALTPATRLVLTNAIYFKGDWQFPFAKKATDQQPFHQSAGKSVAVSMMHQEHSFLYMENADLQLLQLPYAGEKLSMVILLPRQAAGIAALEKQLTAAKIEGWLGAARMDKVQVSLPKFTLTAKLQLVDTLKAMGATDAFVPEKADFSGISTAQRLFLSAIIHKAYLAVDEQGTEAAAATGVVMRALAMPPRPEPPKVFNADHPFLFLIRQQQTGQVLFCGRLEVP